mmetsp:Transcript_9744/g.30226  ORF Transcript_9744/g.30226 Transcript_9744/m.30226 type:complete len:219 (-) Transcript_9744:7-663(-)
MRMRNLLRRALDTSPRRLRPLLLRQQRRPRRRPAPAPAVAAATPRGAEAGGRGEPAEATTDNGDDFEAAIRASELAFKEEEACREARKRAAREAEEREERELEQALARSMADAAAQGGEADVAESPSPRPRKRARRGSNAEPLADPTSAPVAASASAPASASASASAQAEESDQTFFGLLTGMGFALPAPELHRLYRSTGGSVPAAVNILLVGQGDTT